MWQKLIDTIDNLVDGISMYRLLMYYLGGLLVAAIGLSAIGVLHYNAIQMAMVAIILIIACWLINKVFANIFEAPINPESSILTALILALIIPPSLGHYGFLFLLAASGLAISSKYILNVKEKHIFNPAAIAVVLTALGPKQNASWWIGTAVMLPFVIVGGILITRKVRREYMVGSFLLASTITTLIYTVIDNVNLLIGLQNMVLSSPLFFLGFVMLTEPYTSPTTRNKQIIYAVLVGVLIAPQVHFGSFYTTPEIALIIGNIFAYLVSSKTKLFPSLIDKVKIAQDTLEFSFTPDLPLAYEPGQYMEWTLPHTNPDSRGSRRWFTLSSSPTEEEVKIGVKFYEKSSSYKTAMLDMNKSTPIVASQIAGDFIMPKNKDIKLVFIAGGIGITPFRSMIKFLLDNQEKRPVRIIYAAKNNESFAYKDVFDAARTSLGINTIYMVSDPKYVNDQPYTVSGLVTADSIHKYIPDYEDCHFYISGTHSMVESVQAALHELGVHHSRVKVDFFQGYA